MSRYAGKVALVTGGGRGIGRAIAERLIAEGATVFTAQRGDGPGVALAADLGDPEAPGRVVADVVGDAGRLDLLVNNAGIVQEGTALETSLAAWSETMAVNLTAPFLMIRAALPHLIETGGSIVNIGSIEGLGSNPRHPAYCASKAGLNGLTRAIAVDHGADGVRCNAVAPGWIDTDLNIDFVESRPDADDFLARLGDVHPVGRTGTPEEVAALVAWLGSAEAAFVTGQVWTIDGGRMAKLSLP